MNEGALSLKDRIENYVPVREVDKEKSFNQLMYFLLTKIPDCYEALGYSSLWELPLPTANWLIEMFVEEQKLKEKEYRRLRKKK